MTMRKRIIFFFHPALTFKFAQIRISQKKVFLSFLGFLLIALNKTSFLNPDKNFNKIERKSINWLKVVFALALFRRTSCRLVDQNRTELSSLRIVVTDLKIPRRVSHSPSILCIIIIIIIFVLCSVFHIVNLFIRTMINPI